MHNYVNPFQGKTTDWRAGCGKTACPVRREGEVREHLSLPLSVLDLYLKAVLLLDPGQKTCRDDAPGNFFTPLMPRPYVSKGRSYVC